MESTQILYLHGLPGQHGISKAGQRNVEDVIPVLIASTKCHLGPTSQASHPTIPYLYPQPRHLLSFTQQPWLFMTWIVLTPASPPPPPMCPQYSPPCKFLLIIHKFHAMYTSLLTLHPAIPLLCLCYTCYTFLTPCLTAFLFYQETLPAMCLQNSWRCKFLLMTHNSYTSWRIRPYLAPCN